MKEPDKLRESWNNTFGGCRNANKIAVLEEGMKFEPISIAPNEAQFLETRKFQIDEDTTDETYTAWYDKVYQPASVVTGG